MELQSLLSEFKVVKFLATEDEEEELLDGGIAIIDQWICAHARSVTAAAQPVSCKIEKKFNKIHI